MRAPKPSVHKTITFPTGIFGTVVYWSHISQYGLLVLFIPI